MNSADVLNVFVSGYNGLNGEIAEINISLNKTPFADSGIRQSQQTFLVIVITGMIM